jgi:hypothetical protein
MVLFGTKQLFTSIGIRYDLSYRSRLFLRTPKPSSHRIDNVLFEASSVLGPHLTVSSAGGQKLQGRDISPQISLSTAELELPRHDHGYNLMTMKRPSAPAAGLPRLTFKAARLDSVRALPAVWHKLFCQLGPASYRFKRGGHQWYYPNFDVSFISSMLIVVVVAVMSSFVRADLP